MKLGVGTYTYGWGIGVEDARPTVWMNELDIINNAGQFGLDLVQLGDNLPLHGFTAERVNAFAAALQQHHMHLELGARRMTAEHLKMYIQLCGDLNARKLRFVIDGEDFEPSIADIKHIIRSQVASLQQGNIVLAIENHDRFKVRELADIMESIGSENVGICLDTVNSMGAAEGLTTIVDVLGPYTVNLHLKDFMITRLKHQMGFRIEGVPAGKGMLNVPWLLEQLKQYDRCTTAILEQWTPPADTVEQTVERERQWAVESIGYLKQFFQN